MAKLTQTHVSNGQRMKFVAFTWFWVSVDATKLFFNMICPAAFPNIIVDLTRFMATQEAEWAALYPHKKE